MRPRRPGLFDYRLTHRWPVHVTYILLYLCVKLGGRCGGHYLGLVSTLGDVKFGALLLLGSW